MDASLDRSLSRRAFLRGGLAAVPSDLHGRAEIEARAARFGIVPGTRVDAQGRLVEASPLGGGDPFLGEIMIVAFQFVPRNWASCNGQLLPINQNTALFSLLGTTYGGDGQNNFALPDLRGRLAMHVSGSHPLGERTGSETVVATIAQLPAHAHGVPAAATATTTNPDGARYAPSPAGSVFSAASPDAMLTASTGTGGAMPNLPPYLVLNYVIATAGIFPSQL